MSALYSKSPLIKGVSPLLSLRNSQLTSVLHVCHESRGDEGGHKESDDHESGEVPQLSEPAAFLREVDYVNGVLTRSVHIWQGEREEEGKFRGWV